MPAHDLLTEGLWLMLFGMGIVFTFLVVLVFALGAMSKLAALLDPRSAEVPTQLAPAGVQKASVDSDPVAVIAAAVARYRATNRQRNR
jgi:oxaloacetate decarboxylase gamma subunit